MLRDLPPRDANARREHCESAAGISVRDRQRMRVNALKRDVRAAEAEVSKLIGERDHARHRPGAGLALTQRAASVDARLSSLVEHAWHHCGNSHEHAILLARIQRARSSLQLQPGPESPRTPRLVRKPYAGRSEAARFRQAIEAGRRTREDDVSIRTVRGGLPGLGTLLGYKFLSCRRRPEPIPVCGPARHGAATHSPFEYGPRGRHPSGVVRRCVAAGRLLSSR